MVITTRLRVRFYELDPYNHVNHAAYVQYFESARIELLHSVGVDLPELKARGFHLVVTDLHIVYRRPAGPNDVLDIETELVGMRRASSRWRQRMYRGSELVALQEISVATTTVDGKPVRFPADLAEALQPLVRGTGPGNRDGGPATGTDG